MDHRRSSWLFGQPDHDPARPPWLPFTNESHYRRDTRTDVGVFYDSHVQS